MPITAKNKTTHSNNVGIDFFLSPSYTDGSSLSFSLAVSDVAASDAAILIFHELRAVIYDIAIAVSGYVWDGIPSVNSLKAA